MYLRDELKKKAVQTQREYQRQMAKLVDVFGRVPLDQISPGDVSDFMRARGVTLSATRERRGSPRHSTSRALII